MMSILIPNLVGYLLLLMSMAFFTLLERKILGYAQLRKGPNKVMFAGLPQPLADALKLFLKERTTPTQSNKLPYKIAPMMSLVLALLMWFLYTSPSPTYFIPLGIMFFLCVSSVSVYGTLFAGWSSNSKYALLGALRAIAQTISYEVSMMLVILLPILMSNTLSLNHMTDHQRPLPYIIMMFPFFLMWFTTALAETNRTPFDFAEGESELVSGFNVEYSGTAFAFIFMAEYLSILFLSFMTTLLFLWGTMDFMTTSLTTWLLTLLTAKLFLITRATLPRMRYDMLMSLTWKIFLPSMLPALIFYISTIPTLWFY